MASYNDSLSATYSPKFFVHLVLDSDCEPFSRKRLVDSCESENEKEMDVIGAKRCRTDTRHYVRCPLARFGCEKRISCENLQNHYSSAHHRTFLINAVNEYIQKLHTQPMEWCDETDDPNGYQEEIFESIKTLDDNISALFEDNLRTQENCSKLEKLCGTLQNTINNLKLSIDESNQHLNALKLHQTTIESEISSMKTSISQPVGTNSFDGTLTWKITDVARRFQEAESELQASFYSPPFYSSPTGYKMCLRLYLNGDGSAKRTHISLFFVLLRGDYDAILSWPFSNKVIFYLHDQSENKRHIVDSFRPDIKSSSFQRPMSSMNIASGIPRFFPIETLKQPDNAYIRNDTMFISCIVDFDSLPKSVLPTMVRMNPALPRHQYLSILQSELVKQEKEKCNASISDRECQSIARSCNLDNT